MADEKNTKTNCTVQNEWTWVPRKTLEKVKLVCEIEQASFLTGTSDELEYSYPVPVCAESY
jgi:hypothetical protein